ncbi:MAG: hypothetical protein WCZ10_14085 [Desulfobulbaceae bacterium]
MESKPVQLSFEDYYARLQSWEKKPWSRKEMEKLHIRLLEEGLLDLKSEKTSIAKKSEILQWVKKPMEREPRPFSFQLCAMVAGYDPEELRALIVSTMRKILH